MPATSQLIWEEQKGQRSLDEFSPIDKHGLLFRPVPSTPKLPHIPFTPDSDLEEDEAFQSEQWETDALLPGIVSLVQTITHPLPVTTRPPFTQVVTEHLPTPAIPPTLQVDTIRIPIPAFSSAKRRTRKRAIVLSSLLAMGVLLVYLVAPLILTLIPVLPTNWGRVLIAFQLLLLAEIIIYRILYKTTRRNGGHKAKGKIV